MRIIDKQHKPMDNFADRDHCIQYMCAVMLIYGRLTADDYIDSSEAANDPLVDNLRTRIQCVHDEGFTAAYHDPERRFISNAVTVTLRDGTQLDEVVVEAPLGHRTRREEAKPVILEKFRRHLSERFSTDKVENLVARFMDQPSLEEMAVDEFMDLFVVENSRSIKYKKED
jgi:2-methylcitrate dehydratase